MTDQSTISLAQWCAYLLYGIEIAHNVEFVPKHLTYPNFTLNKNNLAYVSDYPERFKPLLHPMNEENKAAINNICSKYNLSFDDCFYCDGKPYGDEANFEIVTTEELPYGLVQELLQNHYDLDGLIPQGLALPIE